MVVQGEAVPSRCSICSPLIAFHFKGPSVHLAFLSRSVSRPPDRAARQGSCSVRDATSNSWVPRSSPEGTVMSKDPNKE